MRDSTLYIGALASNNVNNIVNDAGKYDEFGDYEVSNKELS